MKTGFYETGFVCSQMVSKSKEDLLTPNVLMCFATQFATFLTKKRSKPNAVLNLLLYDVGKTGFEPATPWSQTRCATGLRYFPNDFPLLFYLIEVQMYGFEHLC